jgi:hypothetical protein
MFSKHGSGRVRREASSGRSKGHATTFNIMFDMHLFFNDGSENPINVKVSDTTKQIRRDLGLA